MSILNFGSCCIDHVYSVPHFVAPGETLPCTSYEVHPGGKGLNQSIALANAGASVRHAGKVGQDGAWLVKLMSEKGIDTSQVTIANEPSGHANIQVSADGENSIVLFGGTNRQIDHAQIDEVLNTAESGDFLLLQNEISNLDYLMANAKHLRMVFNAAPMTDEVLQLPIANLELLIINEIEGQSLTGKTEPKAICESLTSNYPNLKIVLTLGEQGAMFHDKDRQVSVSAEPVDVVDTTGAGDTFTGFFLAAYAAEQTIEDCLTLASKAAAHCVTVKGAATSIPMLDQL